MCLATCFRSPVSLVLLSNWLKTVCRAPVVASRCRARVAASGFPATPSSEAVLMCHWTFASQRSILQRISGRVCSGTTPCQAHHVLFFLCVACRMRYLHNPQWCRFCRLRWWFQCGGAELGQCALGYTPRGWPGVNAQPVMRLDIRGAEGLTNRWLALLPWVVVFAVGVFTGMGLSSTLFQKHGTLIRN